MPPWLLSIFPSIISTIGGVLGVDSDTIKAKQIDATLALQQLISAETQKQLDINMAEANNPNRKWITWREALGYVCVTAVSYHFILEQLLSLILSASGVHFVLPTFEISGLMTILSGMLGIHFIDSRYNSPVGVPPTIQQGSAIVSKGSNVSTAITTPPGRLVNDPEAGGLVWRQD